MYFGYLYLIQDSSYIKKKEEIKAQVFKRAQAICTQCMTPRIIREEKNNQVFFLAL